MLTMLLGGLWHGASWTFIAWGGLHGLYLVIERFLKSIVPDSNAWTKFPVRFSFAFITFIAVSFAWIFFRANSFEQAFTIIATMVNLASDVPAIRIERYYVLLTFGITAAILIAHWIMRERSLETIIQKMPWWQRGIVLAVMMFIIVTCTGEDRAFIYFQF